MDLGAVGSGRKFIQHNTIIISWDLMHMARRLNDAGGWANHRNGRNAWKARCRFDMAQGSKPEYDGCGESDSGAKDG